VCITGNSNSEFFFLCETREAHANVGREILNRLFVEFKCDFKRESVAENYSEYEIMPLGRY